MPNKAINNLDPISAITADDYIVIINDPAGVPASVLITQANFFANINVPVQANSVRANTFILSGNTTPPANTNVTGQTAGRLYMGSDNYLYFSANSSHTVRMGPFVTF